MVEVGYSDRPAVPPAGLRPRRAAGAARPGRGRPGGAHRPRDDLARTTSPPATSSWPTAWSRSASRMDDEDGLEIVYEVAVDGGPAPLRLGWSVVLVLALDTATPTLVAGRRALVASTGDRGAGRARRSVGHPARRAADARRSRACWPTRASTMGDLRAVVTGLGPGPFTGLRVGVVTAAALGRRPRPAGASGSARSTRSARAPAPSSPTPAARRSTGRPTTPTAPAPRAGRRPAGGARPARAVRGRSRVRRPARRRRRAGRRDDGGAAPRGRGRSWPTRRPPVRCCRCTCAVPTPPRRRRSRR